jgi:hypothetical protein
MTKGVVGIDTAFIVCRNRVTYKKEKYKDLYDPAMICLEYLYIPPMLCACQAKA